MSEILEHYAQILQKEAPLCEIREEITSILMIGNEDKLFRGKWSF